MTDAPARRVGTLTVVATPLGNPEDLSPRAARALREASLIVAEDTRSARHLLTSLGAAAGGERTILSCYDANEAARADEVADRLRAGADIVLVSEAGTPLVSDPGYRIVTAAIAVGARVVPVPGPSAVLAALVGSGLPPDRFLFHGFPPRRSGARRRLFETLRALPATLVFYESPLRTGATLADLAAALGAQRRACVARELTKEHEELVRDTLGALAARYAERRPLGEVTLVVEGAPADAPAEAWDDEAIAEKAAELLAKGLSARDAAHELAALTGRARREVYPLVVRAAGAAANPRS
ncbi:MAG TPA: 16S rRNA (cytidine(1402)-2'-O)-methyltransferase [Polyangia bacterium]|nr:16S rRNA (cytidine(1402)-2'-O)-methyltransferase [Polyangia bacterium]